MGFAGGPNSFFGYKKDLRGILDFSEIRSEKYQHELQQKYQQQRMILKYRLFGKPGISEREFELLVKMGIIKRKSKEFCRKVKVKKKIQKHVRRPDGRISVHSSEMSGSSASNYTYRTEAEYEDNRGGNPLFVNKGFDILPLDPVIFGKEVADKAKNLGKKMEYIRRQSKLLKGIHHNNLEAYLLNNDISPNDEQMMKTESSGKAVFA